MITRLIIKIEYIIRDDDIQSSIILCKYTVVLCMCAVYNIILLYYVSGTTIIITIIRGRRTR